MTIPPGPSEEISSSLTMVTTPSSAILNHEHVQDNGDIQPLVLNVDRLSSPDMAPPIPDKKEPQVKVEVKRKSTDLSGASPTKPRLLIQWPNSKHMTPSIHWYTPTMMVLLGLAGLFGGLGHHLYNSKLDGRPIPPGGDSQWPQRWGVAIAFFVKMTLVGAVQTAVKQRAWVCSPGSPLIILRQGD